MYKINLNKTYSCSANEILSYFKENIIFKLTGADIIESDFIIGGKFRLTFTDRGIIYGSFISIGADKIILDWNVTGFKMADEKNTMVIWQMEQIEQNCRVSLIHDNIISEESGLVKERAWSEILNDLEQLISNK